MKALNPTTILCVFVYFFFRSISFHLFFFGSSIVRYIRIYDCHVCLENASVYKMAFLKISNYIPSFEIYSILTVYTCSVFVMFVCLAHLTHSLCLIKLHLYTLNSLFWKQHIIPRGFHQFSKVADFVPLSPGNENVSSIGEIGELGLSRISTVAAFPLS